MNVNSIEGMSKSQVARELGVSGARVDQMLTAGQLPYAWTALGRLVDREAVMRLKEERLLADQKKKEVRNDREAA